MDRFATVVKALNDAGVRFVVIGVWGINHYARSGGTLFTTKDRDLFLPRDPNNLLRAWKAFEAGGLMLWSGNREPLDTPRDELLAERVVERQALTVATDEEGLHIDLSFVMGGFIFEEVWPRRRTFMVEDVAVPVARLSDIVVSKAQVGRDKDRLFLATHREALQRLQRWDDASPQSGPD